MLTAINDKQDSISDRDAVMLSSKLLEAIAFWDKEKSHPQAEFEAASLYYGTEREGVQYKSVKAVVSLLKK